MYAENRTLAEATNYTTTNALETPSLTDGTLVPVELHDSSCTNDIDVAGATPLIEIDTIPAPIPTESTLPAVVSSVITVDLTGLKDQIDNVLAHEHDESETISRLLKIEADLETEATSATTAANFARFKVGFLLEQIKKAQRGLLEKVKKAYAERHQRGNGNTTLNKAHTYYLIPNILKYLCYSYEKVLFLYKEAKDLFKNSSDPISDFLKSGGTTIEDIDLQQTSLETIKLAIALRRISIKKGLEMTFATAFRLVKADKAVPNKSFDLWDEVHSYCMEISDTYEAIDQLIRDKEEARKIKVTPKIRHRKEVAKEVDSTENRDPAHSSPEAKEGTKSIKVDPADKHSSTEEIKGPIQQAKEKTPVTPSETKHPKEVIMKLDLSRLFDWVTERIREEKKRPAAKGAKCLVSLGKLLAMAFEYQDAVQRATAK